MTVDSEGMGNQGTALVKNGLQNLQDVSIELDAVLRLDFEIRFRFWGADAVFSTKVAATVVTSRFIGLMVIGSMVAGFLSVGNEAA